MIENKDKKLLEIMADSLEKYLKASGSISNHVFGKLSKYNGLLWSELEDQKKIIEKILSEDNEESKEENEQKENAQLKLYNDMVEYLKKQKCVELQWVKIYSVKLPQQDSKDFEIKYYEHKDPYAAHKNYILFGDTTKNYSIRKEKNDVTGDTEKCFDYILNLREKLGLEQIS
ncbi:UNVERIFIED_CONTAM: hypothetical protein Cloal_2505 [Acetivibrio alkalicellulosi]